MSKPPIEKYFPSLLGVAIVCALIAAMSFAIGLWSVGLFAMLFPVVVALIMIQDGETS